MGNISRWELYGGELSGGGLSGGQLSDVGVIRGGLVLSDNYPEENCLGDNFLEGIVPFLFLNANFAMKNSELKDQSFWGLARITVTFCISCICL